VIIIDVFLSVSGTIRCPDPVDRSLLILGIIMIGIIITIPPTAHINEFFKEWNEQMDAWVKEKWTTSEFYDNVARLSVIINDVDGANGAHPIYMSALKANGLELRDWLVPVHVRLKCDRRILNGTIEVKKLSAANCPDIELIKAKKKEVKSDFLLFQSLGIFTAEEDPRAWYERAEKCYRNAY
jgi:hypothetical protein